MNMPVVAPPSSRNAAIAAASRLTPGLLLRAFDGIADWRPTVGTYAANAVPR
jgi:hypothetical protein